MRPMPAACSADCNSTPNAERIFDLSTGRVKASYDARDTVHGMSFAEDDSVVALGLAEGVCALNVNVADVL